MRINSPSLEMINTRVMSNETFGMDHYFEHDVQNQDHITRRIYIFIQTNYDSIYGGFLHIYCIIVFEIIFYFNYITEIEKKEILKIINTFATNIKYYDNIEDISTDIEKYCNIIGAEFIDKQNSELQNNAYSIIWGLTVMLVVIIATHCKIINNSTKFCNKTMEALISIGFIILFEFYFFTNIVEKYNIVSSNEAMCYLLETINDRNT